MRWIPYRPSAPRTTGARSRRGKKSPRSGFRHRAHNWIACCPLYNASPVWANTPAIANRARRHSFMSAFNDPWPHIQTPDGPSVPATALGPPGWYEDMHHSVLPMPVEDGWFTFPSYLYGSKAFRTHGSGLIRRADTASQHERHRSAPLSIAGHHRPIGSPAITIHIVHVGFII